MYHICYHVAIQKKKPIQGLTYKVYIGNGYLSI